MHENRNLFLFLIKINNMHRTRHILPIPRTCIWNPVFGAGAAGAVFGDIRQFVYLFVYNGLSPPK